MRHVDTATKLLAAPCFALLFFAACSSTPNASGGPGCVPQCTGSVCGGDGCNGSCGTCREGQSCAGGTCVGGGNEAGVGGDSGRGGGIDARGGGDTGGGGIDARGPGDTGGGGIDARGPADTGGGGIDARGPADTGGGDTSSADVNMSFDATNTADVMWGPSCLYDTTMNCPFPLGQECGLHQGIVVTFPNGPELLNATLFSGFDCSPNALNDNFNDSQRTMGTGIWLFTDDADVAGVSASNPTSAIWWVGPLTASGYPPAGAPTTGCINYTTATAMCQ